MERERLGPWAPGGMVDGMRVAAPSSGTDRACLGKIESAEPVRGGSRLRGWIATPDGETSSHNPVVLDAGGRRSGLGLVGIQRPDVEPPDAEWAGFVAYVRGKPAVPLEIVLLAENGANAVCRLTWAGGRRG